MTTIVKMIFGSHMYGLATPQSDKDYKGIFIPEYRDVILCRAPDHRNSSTGDDRSRNTADDVDDEEFSLTRFVQMACKGETISIDMLHCPKDCLVSSSQVWEELTRMRRLFYTKDMTAYMGYVRKQAAKYGVKGSRIAVLDAAMEVLSGSESSGHARLAQFAAYLPMGEHSSFEDSPSGMMYVINGRKFHLNTRARDVLTAMRKIREAYGHRAEMAKNNQGIDWKAVSHAFRAGFQLRSIFKYGDFEYPLLETPQLRRIKSGEVSWDVAQGQLESLVAQVEELSKASDFPEKVDKKTIDDWMFGVLDDHYAH